MVKYRSALYFGESLADTRLFGEHGYVIKSVLWPVGWIDFQDKSFKVGYPLHVKTYGYADIEEITKGSAAYIQVKAKDGSQFGFAGPKDALVVGEFRKRDVQVVNPDVLVRNSNIANIVLIIVAFTALVLGLGSVIMKSLR